VSHGVLGWLLFPLRYADLPLFRSPYLHRIGNHCYLWLRKDADPGAAADFRPPWDRDAEAVAERLWRRARQS
jgi:hypothetical protein